MKLWLLSFFLLLPTFDAPPTTLTDTSRSEAQAQTGRQEVNKQKRQTKAPAQPQKKKKSKESFGRISYTLGVLAFFWLGIALALQSPVFALWLIQGFNILGHILAFMLFFISISITKKVVNGRSSSSLRNTLNRISTNVHNTATGCLATVVQITVVLGLIATFVISNNMILAANFTSLYIIAGIAFILLLYIAFGDITH